MPSTTQHDGGPAVLVVLLIAPLINLAINHALDHSWHLQSRPQITVGPGHWLFNLANELVVLIVVLAALWIVQRRRRPGPGARRLLELLGAVTTLQSLLNAALVLIAMSALQLGSVGLLLIGTGLYTVLNSIALFWYWCLDHEHFGSGLVGGSGRGGGVVFPEGDAGGRFFDYLYFTVLSSNTLGPPENHQVLGFRFKLLQLLQSSLMLALVVIVVARAINTLG